VLRTALQFLRSAGFYLYPLFPNYTNPEKLPPDRPQSRDVRLRVLGGVTLLRVLSPVELEMIADGTVGRMVMAGHTLIEAGQPGDTMWVIAEGSFDVIVEKDGVPFVATTLWPGDWVGEMSLLTGEPRTATVRSRTPSLVYAIKKPIMEKLFEADPELILSLAQVAGRRRKSRERPFSPLQPDQDRAKTQSTISRICVFFGLPSFD
jgi:CRP-like cAMP-binding protein